VEVVASLSQGRTAAAQFGLFTHKSVPVIFEPPCTSRTIYQNNRILNERRWRSDSLLYLQNKEQQANKIQCRKNDTFFFHLNL